MLKHIRHYPMCKMKPICDEKIAYPHFHLWFTLLCRIYTFVRVARRIARRMTSTPITYSPHHLLRYSPRRLWSSHSKRFFKHESKETNGDLRYVYEYVSVRTHAKTHHSHRDRGIRMFMQVARRGTSMNV